MNTGGNLKEQRERIGLLIVDDNAADIAFYRRLLESCEDTGFDILEATSGEAGIAAFRRFQPDAVVLDYHLGDISGVEFLCGLRREWPDRSVPVVVLTGDDHPKCAVEAMKVGAHDFLTKDDVSAESLKLAIVRAVEKCRHDLALREKSDEMDRTRREAEERVRAKSSFLANVSHEIRTPLTAILGFAEELKSQVGEESARESANLILDNAEHLLEIVNDILDLSKIEDGNMRVENLRVSPQEIIYGLQRVFEPRAQEKGLSFRVEFASPVPETIETDPLRLRQILINLIGNAIKFTDSGSIELWVYFVESIRAEIPPAMFFAVVDTGIGMDDEAVGRLFKPFSQAESSTARRFGGTGLGLSISKHLASLLGGDITVRSAQGCGSVFKVSIATGDISGVERLVPDGLVIPERSEPNTDDLVFDGNPRVLVVDDAPANRLLIRRMLERAGATVTTVDDGSAAVQHALDARQEGQAFDVVLMDVQMPIMDGRAATQSLRGQGYEGVIVALSADARPEDQQMSIDAGCDDCLAKPIDRRALVERIAKIVDGDRVAAP